MIACCTALALAPVASLASPPISLVTSQAHVGSGGSTVVYSPALDLQAGDALNQSGVASLGIWDLAFQQGAVDGDLVSTGEYRVDVHPHGGVHVTAASQLETPLLDFGVAPTWGIDARTPWGQEAIGTPLGVQLLQHVAVLHEDLFAGFTPLGPLAGIQLSTDALSTHATVLLSTGQVQTAESITLRAGDVSVSYDTVPATNGVTARLTWQPFDFTISAGNAGSQVGLGYTVSEGQTLQVLWSTPGGFQVVFTALLG